MNHEFAAVGTLRSPSGAAAQPTVADLLRQEGLNLRLRTPHVRLDDRPISWFNISELLDPTPFLDHGDILFTMCLLLPADDPVAVDAYVARLAERGVSAIGVSAGPAVLPEAPGSLVQTAEAYGIPVFEVPASTRFVGVTRSLSALVESVRADEQRRVLEAQRRMTQAAASARGGQRGVLAELANAVGGWAMITAVTGSPEVMSAEAPPSWLASAREEIERIRPRGLRASASLTRGDTTLAIFPLGLSGRPYGFLTVAATTESTAAPRGSIMTAMSLLNLMHDQRDPLRASYPQLVTEMMRLLLEGDLSTARSIDRAIHPATRFWTSKEPLSVLVAATSLEDETAQEGLLDLLEEARRLGTHYAAIMDSTLVLLVPRSDTERAATALTSTADGVAVGVSHPVPRTDLAAGLRSARDALRAARHLGRPVVRFGLERLADHPGPMESGDQLAWARLVLAPLDAHPELRSTLARYLRHHGRLLPAAADLDVHRQTLRTRLRSIESALGVDLDAPGTRARLWLALEAMGAGE